ncbi:universal stress protein [Nocardia puris]|uniref:Nucleotide-binding universal stress UspA family protein n=1 Tax=Nocardia puris TaxID=208602 RepID=A0A366DWH8_9NOCA|nr:universal stress protein [Nocardia puris]RBO94446.1 nucleotide-binding universal stress UspA family protein [Nocardia puris]
MAGNAPIVVGVDGSAGATTAVTWAAHTAALHRAPLLLLHVVDVVADYGPGSTEPLTATDYDRLAEHGRWLLGSATARAEEAAADLGGVEVRVELVQSPATPTLLARSEGARMIAVGTRDRGSLRRALLG